MKKLPNGFIDKTVCKQCGGECCRNGEPVLLPEDVALTITLDVLVSGLKSKAFIVDFWDGGWENTPGYFLRFRNIKDPADRFKYGSWGDECVHFSWNGCDLDFNNRPWNCRWVMPTPPSCKFVGTLPNRDGAKAMAIKSWLPFTDLIDKALDVLTEPTS